ncbi:sugar ABC transporter permease [Streptacidiphilus sp. PB12-B1b]|nr:sugar ABC transporter permease [Streptacidiphilus sp. PB12-B1b]
MPSKGAQTGLRDDGGTAVAAPGTSGDTVVGAGKAAKTAGSRPKRRSNGSTNSAVTPYLLLLPALVAMLVLLVWPSIDEILISFQRLNAFELIGHVTRWTGFDNYQSILSSSTFWQVFERTVVFTAVNVVLIMVGGTLIGLLLNRLGTKIRFVLSIALVFAWAVPVLAATTVFQWLFDQQTGVVDWTLAQLGWKSMAHFDWMSNEYSAFSVVVLCIVWQSIPFVAFNVYAGLTTISNELYEAARLDGAGPLRIFRSVIFPMLKPFFYGTVFLEIIWVFGALTQVLEITGGNPVGKTVTLPVYAYEVGVGQQAYGMGSAVAVVTIVMLCLMMSFYFRIILKQEDEL